MPAVDLLSSLGLGPLINDGPYVRDTGGTLRDPTETRVVFAATETMSSLHAVIEGEQAGAWRIAMKATGGTCGRTIATDLETRLAAIGKPALSALPLEACLALLERHFALHGWGRLMVDLTHAADHGLVVARLEHSYFVETLTPANAFVDSMLAGILQGYFEHISGQALGCEEIACAGHRLPAGGNPPHCTFVITAPERLAIITPLLGRETADALIARLRA
jgi:predicted hydrocarbon binding protein